MWARKHLALILVFATLGASVTAAVYIASLPPASGLLPFDSYAALNDYMKTVRSAANSTGMWYGNVRGPAGGSVTAPISAGPDYSGTNVQVAGVDELDPVKTDGTYLYAAFGDRVTVFLAYPATDLHVVAHIALGNLTTPVTGSDSVSAVGLFLDGSTLLVVADAYAPVASGGGISVGGGAPNIVTPIRGLWLSPQLTLAFRFDVSDPTAPVLEQTVAISGSTFTGRMVGSVAYLVTNSPILEVNGTYEPPVLCEAGVCCAVSPGAIYHDPESMDAYSYTNLLALDLATGDARPMVLVTGWTSVLYMSPTAIYLAYYKWSVTPQARMAVAIPVGSEGRTSIYKLEASGLDIVPAASADVAGSLLSQYSMDEWTGMLRVATTSFTYSANGTTESSQLYVFDGSLKLLGSVGGIAPGESIYAVRFLGDHAYLVTYQKIDPLFVVDLSDPSTPTVRGILTMPGFSSYLYPLDPGHLIGVGKDALPTEENFSWYQGLKLSLYDVTNATDPRETANVSLGDRGTQSQVLYDPHAFLYVPDRQYIVLPVDLAIIDPSQYPGGVPPYAYGNIVWQGAYVYQVNETTGFTYIGRIAHGNGTVNGAYSWYGSPTEIRRSLYIGDVLYTVSQTEVLASSLADLSEIAHVVYASPPACVYCGPLLA